MPELTHYVVTSAFETTNPDPISFKAGELIKVGQKFTDDPEWTNWIKCENAMGKSGWTPLEVLRIDGEWATAVIDYTAHELTVAIGDCLVVAQLLNGWAWACTESGEWGWVPARNLERQRL